VQNHNQTAAQILAMRPTDKTTVATKQPETELVNNCGGDDCVRFASPQVPLPPPTQQPFPITVGSATPDPVSPTTQMEQP